MRQLIVVYLTIEYLLPVIGISMFGASAYYREIVLSESVIFSILLLLAIIWLTLQASTLEDRYSYRFKTFSSTTILVIALFFLACSIVGLAAGVNNFRYGNEGMLISFGPLSILFSLSTVILTLTALYLFIFDRSLVLDHSLKSRVTIIAISIGSILSINGLGTAITSLIVLSMMLFPTATASLLVKGEAQRFRIVKTIAAIPVLFLAGLLVALLGISAKLGVAPTTNLDFLERYSSGEYFVNRSSPQLYSLLIALESGYAWGSSQLLLLEPLNNFFYRLDSLLGGFMNIQRPNLGSMARINLIFISEYAVNAREGTSPGLIAGFFIGTPKYVGFLLFTTFFWLSLWLLKPLVSAIPVKLTILGYYVIGRLALVWIYGSPPDLLQILDESFIVLSLLVFCRFRVERTTKSFVSQRDLMVRSVA